MVLKSLVAIYESEVGIAPARIKHISGEIHIYTISGVPDPKRNLAGVLDTCVLELRIPCGSLSQVKR